MKTETIIENARRMGKTAEVVAFALALTTEPSAQALCVWCLDAQDPGQARTCYRLPRGGECSCCPVVGYDVLVVC